MAKRRKRKAGKPGPKAKGKGKPSRKRRKRRKTAGKGGRPSRLLQLVKKLTPQDLRKAVKAQKLWAEYEKASKEAAAAKRQFRAALRKATKLQKAAKLLGL